MNYSTVNSYFGQKYKHILETLWLLPKSDRRKLVFLGFIQLAVALLDLCGILLIGLVSSLGLSVISNIPISSSFSFVYKIPVIGDLPLEKITLWLGLISAFLLICKTILNALIMKKIVGFLAMREALISSDYISKISRTSPNWQLGKSPQYIAGVAIEGAHSAITLTLGQLVILIVEILSMGLIFLGISTFDLTITIPSFVFFLVSGLIALKFLTLQTQNAGKQEFELSITSRDIVKNMIVGSRELFLSNKRKVVTDQYSAQRIGNFRAVRTKTLASLIPKYVSEITMVFGGVLITFYQFAIKDAKGAITGLVLFAALSSRILPSLLRLQAAVLQIQGSATASKNFIEEYNLARLEDMGQGRVATQRALNSLNESEFSPTLSLQKIVARHSKGSDFEIRDVSISIFPGEFFAIVGPSGSGKTTLVDVLLGIIDPKSGIALISGLLPSEAVTKWPNAIRCVPQDIHLIPGTILSNIIWPDSNSSLDNLEIDKLLETVELGEWVKSLEKGILTTINSLGSNISGGQRQRLGIARALYSSPKILFLDESTSALDLQTEKHINDKILRGMNSITRVVITHRISTIRKADRILYIDNGKMVAMGNYDEIIKLIPTFGSSD